MTSIYVFAITLCALAAATTAFAARPNIVFFITDDQFKHLTSWMPQGEGSTYTPVTDQLAGEGVVLRQQYVTSPVCTPSRFSAMTGLYPSRTRNEDFVQRTQQAGQTVVGWNTYVTPELPTVASRLRQAGYRTGFVGKNHVVETPDFERGDPDSDTEDPEVKAQLVRNEARQKAALAAAGFDYSASLYQNNPGHNCPRSLGGHNLDWIAQGAGEFIAASAEDERPFFLWLASTIPHGPLTPDRSWAGDRRVTASGLLPEPLNLLSSAAELEARLESSGFSGVWHTQNMLWLDDLVGYVMNQLKASGSYDDTVFIYFSDHGQLAKGTIYQGGVHSLAFVWRSGGFPVGAATDVRVSNIDFVPTILDLAGVDYDPAEFDGRTMLPVLTGETDQLHDALYFELGFVHGVLKGDYKYIALKYPESAIKMSRTRRAEILERFNDSQRRRDRPVYTEDPTEPFSHVQLIPGGGDAEHASRGKYPSFTDAEQLYHVIEDPDEQVNLVEDPACADTLDELRTLLQGFLETTRPDYLEKSGSRK